MLESSQNHPLHPQSVEKLSSMKDMLPLPGAQKVGDSWPRESTTTTTADPSMHSWTSSEID